MGNLAFQEIFFLSSFLIILIVGGKKLTDWLHEIKKRNRYMEAQIRLLMHIASKHGEDADKIAEIVAEAELPHRKTTE